MHHTLAYIDWLMPSWSLWYRGGRHKTQTNGSLAVPVIVKEMGHRVEKHVSMRKAPPG